MATFLCSLLIGAGFPAMVVSGSAKAETVNNDQRNVDYPLPNDNDPSADDAEDVTIASSNVSDKYKLKPKPDLTSHLEDKLAQIKLEKETQAKLKQEEIARIERENLEDEISFNDPKRLSHAWVVIINNAPWSTQPRTKMIDEDGEEIDEPPSILFIEPSTGFHHDKFTKAYIHIESVWNHLNYYVNLQKCRIREMNWDLRETSEWEHFLAGEPPEMRVVEEVSDENLTEESTKISVEKHLDMGRTWVQKLYISEKEFDEVFPKLYKAVYYKQVLHERYSSHTQSDGKVEQLTYHSDNKYEIPAIRWVWYENRSDLMTKLKYTYVSALTEEAFLKGRPDSLKYFLHYFNDKLPKIMHFYSTPRLDSLRYCKVYKQVFVLHFEKSPGACYYKEFVTKSFMTKLKAIKEKFQRNPLKPANKDISIRSFLIAQNRIVLKFHYVRGALTATTREFIKPPKPDYGQEIIFNPALTKGFKFGDTDPEPTQLELYLLLLDQLKAEENAKKDFQKHLQEVNGIFELRNREMKHTILKFRCFDPLRNATARQIRMQKDKLEAQIKNERWANLPDFLAPYLVPYNGNTLTPEESWEAYNACLDDLKTRFVSLLNELQRRYEDLTAEAQSLKKFINKFQNKFEDFDYERLLKESKDLELIKRMVQKRLTITHEEAQKKYDMVKQSLLNDDRLNLK